MPQELWLQRALLLCGHGLGSAASQQASPRYAHLFPGKLEAIIYY